jgi:hypothetical protein
MAYERIRKSHGAGPGDLPDSRRLHDREASAMVTLTFPEVLDHSIKPLRVWIAVRRLKAVRVAALRHMAVAEGIIQNEQANYDHYQKVEMETKRELRELGIPVEDPQ